MTGINSVKTLYNAALKVVLFILVISPSSSAASSPRLLNTLLIYQIANATKTTKHKTANYDP
jgi:hypothetical protein